MREWCLVIGALSSKDAARIGDALGELGLDFEVESQKARVLCFADSETAIRGLSEEIKQTLVQASLWEAVRAGRLWVWNEREHRYVDPQHRDEDPESDGTHWEPDTDWEPNIDATAAVRAHIHERGGRLYVWLADIGGGGMAMEKVSTSDPGGGRNFDEHDAGDFTLFLERGFQPPMIKLSLRRWWPLAPISMWTGLERFEPGD